MWHICSCCTHPRSKLYVVFIEEKVNRIWSHSVNLYGSCGCSSDLMPGRNLLRTLFPDDLLLWDSRIVVSPVLRLAEEWS